MRFLSNSVLNVLIAFDLLVALSSGVPFDARVIGGKAAKPGQFPFIVSIEGELDEIKIHGHYCGGSILNNQWVLTAGHCLYWEPERIYIHAGSNLLDTGTTRYNISQVIRHPGFNTDLTGLHNDIGLLKIDGEIEFTDTVNSIKIGDVSDDNLCTLAGWGLTENLAEDAHEWNFPNELQFVEETALSYEDCVRLAEDSEFPEIVPEESQQVCAFASNGIGACNADSGGPLIYNNTLVGVVSYTFNEKCAIGSPDVYVRTMYYSDWIKETINANS